MADNGRWFKVWTSILDDGDMTDLDLEDVGRWALLGALMKSAGTNGVLHVNGTGRRLCELLRVPDLDAARAALARLPNVLVTDYPLHWRHGRSRPPSLYPDRGTPSGAPYRSVDKWVKSGEQLRGETGNNPGERNGGFFVTFRNWRKYQEDTTAAARGKALRAKRRGEERRVIQDPSDTREVITQADPSDPPVDSEGLSSLWESDGRKPPGPDGIEGRNGRDLGSEVRELVSGVAAARSIVPTRRRVGV